MKKMKTDHEALWATRPFRLPDEAIDLIIEKELSLWGDLSSLNSEFLEKFNLAMPRGLGQNPIDNVDCALTALNWNESRLDEITSYFGILPERIINYLEKTGVDITHLKSVPYYQNPFHNVFWEMLNLGFPNNYKIIRSSLKLVKAFLLFQALGPVDTYLSHRTMAAMVTTAR